MAGSDDEATPEGWYRQKDDPRVLRWWDGHGWTGETMAVPAPDDVAPAAPATRSGRLAATSAGLDLDAIGEPDRTRPAIRIGADDARPAPPRRAQPLQPSDRPRRPGQAPDRPRRRGEDASGRGTGRARPAPPPGDDRPRTDSWPEDRVPPRSAAPSGAARAARADGTRRPRPAAGSDATHRVGARSGRDPADAARLAGRVVAVVAVLVVLLVAYVKLRDASPGNARTLPSAAAPVAKDSPTAIPLAKVVLTLNDLPAGWATQAYSASADDICLGRVPRSVLVPLQVQTAAFTKGPSGPFITNVVMRFANEDVAKHFMDLTAQTAESCRNYVSNGSVLKLGPSSFPKLGDDTYVTKVTGSSSYGALDGTNVYVRRGDRVAAVQTISLASSTVGRDLLVFISRILAHRL